MAVPPKYQKMNSFYKYVTILLDYDLISYCAVILIYVRFNIQSNRINLI